MSDNEIEFLYSKGSKDWGEDTRTNTHTQSSHQGLDAHKREKSHIDKHNTNNCCIIANTHTHSHELPGFLSLTNTHMLQFFHPHKSLHSNLLPKLSLQEQ